MKTLRIVSLYGLVFLTLVGAFAQTGSGDVEIWTGTFPTNLRDNQFTSNTHVRLLTEHLNHTVPNDINLLDAVAPGLYDEESDLGTFTLPANSVVNVYLLHSDTVNDQDVSFTGSVTFPFRIIGVIVR